MRKHVSKAWTHEYHRYTSNHISITHRWLSGCIPTVNEDKWKLFKSQINLQRYWNWQVQPHYKVHAFTDRQTDIYFIRRILINIVIQHGLQYNAHDSGYSNKQDKNIPFLLITLITRIIFDLYFTIWLQPCKYINEDNFLT